MTKEMSLADYLSSNMLADASAQPIASIPHASNMLADASAQPIASMDDASARRNLAARIGGRARSASMSSEERSALASRAARARWSKRKKSQIGFAPSDFQHE